MRLTPRKTSTASVLQVQNNWQLYLPADEAPSYRLAQLDDYTALPRRRFSWRPPRVLSLEARVSADSLPGTWGFGWWNDPFGLSFGFGGRPFRLPCLPNAAWFFHASPENYLSFQDGQPAQGFMAQVFRSPRVPSLLLAPAALGLPFLAMRSASRSARRLAGRLVQEDAAAIRVDVTQWHKFSLEWSPNRVIFEVDETRVLETPIAPRPPLGVVIWIDNQFAAWRPDGVMAYGVLGNPACWLEVRNLTAGS